MNEQVKDLDQVLASVAARIGGVESWKQWPGGWRGDIEAALVDAVFSARAVYKTKSDRGIYPRVVAWRNSRGRERYSLNALLDEIDSLGISEWASRFGNNQVSPHRPATAPGGRLKAATVRQSASKLISIGIARAEQIDDHSASEVKVALRSVPGIGYATTNYFLMLLGAPGVKPDRMIHRFLRQATGHAFSNAQADSVVCAAAERLGVQPNRLDHAIWSFESYRAQGS